MYIKTLAYWDHTIKSWNDGNAAKGPRFKIRPIKSGIGRLKRFCSCNFQSFQFSIHSVCCLENSFRKASERQQAPVLDCSVDYLQTTILFQHAL